MQATSKQATTSCHLRALPSMIHRTWLQSLTHGCLCCREPEQLQEESKQTTTPAAPASQPAPPRRQPPPPVPTSINGVSRKSVTLFNARPPFGPSPRVISLLNEQQNHAEYDAWIDRKLNIFSAEITRHAVALAGSYCLPRALVSKLAGRV